MNSWLHSSWRLPVALLATAVVLGTALLPWPRALYLALTSEAGLVENATVLTALGGAGLALSIWGLRGRLGAPVLGFWFLLFALGLIFLAGEEISWGQQYLHWETPAGFAARNYQRETNLHNLQGVDVDAPAVILGLGVFVGGIAWPLWVLVRRRAGVMDGWLGSLWPSARLWPAAAIALALWATEVTLVQRGLDQSPALRTHYVAIREAVELFLIVYVLLYLADVRRRLGPREQGLVPLGD
jgi:hypothetical protein